MNKAFKRLLLQWHLDGQDVLVPVEAGTAAILDDEEGHEHVQGKASLPGLQDDAILAEVQSDFANRPHA